MKVQMTRVQLGPNGEKQRLTIERDFKSEHEMNKFFKEFEESAKSKKSKASAASASATSSTHKTDSSSSRRASVHTPHQDLIRSPG